MPYVFGFTNDIFISFSHADNSRGWIKEFQNQLNARLIQLGADVTIWRDSKLRGTDVFSDEIFTQLQDSALLLSIVSPSGIKSRWCEDERQAFERFAALNGGFRFGNQLRAVKVVKTPLPDDQHRDLFGVLGYEFYKPEEQPDRFHEFHPSSPEFQLVLDALAQDLKSMLDNFRRHRETAPKTKTVYVATTTPALKRSRDTIVQQLEDWGYVVAPQNFEPGGLASFEAVTKAELAASIFSVHLVSDQPGPMIESGHDSISKQYELAHSLRKDRIIWVEPGHQLYREFDEALKQGLQRGVEILKERDIEDLKDVIEERLNRLRKPARNKSKVELYLICDRADHPFEDPYGEGQRALSVKEYLDENGLAVMPSPFSPMEWNELEEEYRAQLQFSNAVLLYWGAASENWFLKIRRIIVNERIRRNKTSSADTLTEAFYFSSPPMKKSQYGNLAEFVFEQYHNFEPNALKPLLDRLLTNEEAG